MPKERSEATGSLTRAVTLSPALAAASMAAFLYSSVALMGTERAISLRVTPR